eukprot:8149660-Pyramimonas_sp.AAC.1
MCCKCGDTTVELAIHKCKSFDLHHREPVLPSVYAVKYRSPRVTYQSTLRAPPSQHESKNKLSLTSRGDQPAPLFAF